MYFLEQQQNYIYKNDTYELSLTLDYHGISQHNPRKLVTISLYSTKWIRQHQLSPITFWKNFLQWT